MWLDLTRPAHLVVALGPDVLLITGAMLLLLWSAWRPDSAGHQRAVGIGSLVLLALTAAATIWYMQWGLDEMEYGVVALDRFRWIANLVLLLGTSLTIAMSIDYNAREGIDAGESHVLLLFALSGMMLLASARDLVLVFIGIELVSISVYALAAMNRRSIRGAEGALKYFLLGAFATAFLLYGIALVFGATGATNIVTIGERIALFDLTGSPMLLIGIALLLVGFGFKVAVAPFHMWAPDVYEGAPTPITAFMAASVKAAAFVAFIRVWIEAFPLLMPAWLSAVVGLAILTMFAGNLIALAQRNVKRLLAYSSIAHAGYLLVAVAAGSEAGMSAMLFYLFAYTLATMGAFAVLVAVGSRGEPHQTLDDYSGLWHVRPWMAGAMAVFMLALLGFPIFGGIGFFAKWYVILAALEAQQPLTVLAVLLVLTSVISAGYYLYVVMVMFMRDRAASAPVTTSGPWTNFVIAATAILILALGVYPQPVLRLMDRGGSAPPVAATAAPPPAAPLR